jgi:Fungal chitosanase of glycosyl hydrolase group 75
MPFKPPAASKRQLGGVPFERAVDFAVAAKKKFDAADRKPGNRDPSRCRALLKFPDSGDQKGAVFWSSKMAIDADGPSAGPGRLKGRELDPSDGQNDTTFHFSDGRGLPSEAVAYIVVPEREPGSKYTFDPAVGIGDIAVVIFKDKIAAAICGDIGPSSKIGEASIRIHEVLQQQGCPDPCTKRNDKGFCQRARNASVAQDVLYFVFPGSAFARGELTFDNINTKVKERAFALYNKLRG